MSKTIQFNKNWFIKRKKIKYEKKRQINLKFDFGEKVAIDRVELNKKTSEAHFYKNGKILIPKEISIETSYKRKKGSKILNRVSVSHEHCYANPNPVLKKYDLIFGIDTNSKLVNNELISVSCIVYGEIKLDKDKENSILVNKIIGFFEFRNIIKNPEKVAWKKLIETIIYNSFYSKDNKVGIIVDCDLNSLSDINKRSRALLDDYYIPNNFELIYASSDVGGEFIPNKIISICDKESSKLLNYIIKNIDDKQNLLKVNTSHFSHFRAWNNKNLTEYQYWFNLGNHFLIKEKYENALSAFKKAIKISPNSYQALTSKGNALSFLGRPKEAIIEYEKSIEINPNDFLTWYHKGLILAEISEFDKAFLSYNKSIEINPEFFPAFQNLAELLLIENKFQDSLKIINDANKIIHLTEDFAIICYLECIARKMIDLDVSSCEEKFLIILKETFNIYWNFNQIEKWLKKSNFSNNKINYIIRLTELLKKKYIKKNINFLKLFSLLFFIIQPSSVYNFIGLACQDH